MLVTTLLVATVAHRVWRLPLLGVIPVTALFLALDVTFVSANVHKIPAGGWFPLLIGIVSLTLMLCWRRGRAIALAKRDEGAITLATFITALDQPGAPIRMPGCAVYLTTQSETLPAALALNVKHNGIVHDHVILLKVMTDRVPRLAEDSRMRAQDLAVGFQRVELHFGFAEKPDVPAALAVHQSALACDVSTASYFLGRETPVPSLRPDLPRWQERIYAFLTRNAVSAPDYFLIPWQRVVELGTKVEM
jgi:KUP system potassium uptake protein